MEGETDQSQTFPSFLLNIDLRPVGTRHAISAIRKYLELMEKQMPIVQEMEFAALEADRPEGDDEEDRSIHSSIVTYTENLFEEDLVPTMRYSFIIFLHTVFETRLRDFCDRVRLEQNHRISVADLRGSAIDQARDYLTKLAAIPVADYPEWSQLKNFQKIRDCIVHTYGFIHAGEDRFASVKRIIDSDPDLTLNHRSRISPGSKFCERHLANVESFLNRIMTALGWKIN